MKRKPFFFALLTVAAVIFLSLLAVNLWGGKPEVIERYEIRIDNPNMTAAGIARQNQLPLQPVLKALGIDSTRATRTTLTELNIEPAAAVGKITKMMVLYDEQRTKNWVKIFIKFAFWFILLPVPLILLIRKKMNPKKRKWLYGLSVVIIGVALGSDPSPMGTVKDAVFLITAHGTVFWPRMAALGIFLLTVVVANKFICSWGCQFGVLQDFLFRLNRKKHDFRGLTRQYKPPFWLSNGVRIVFFIVFTIVGLVWAFDFIELIDPFKIYNPAKIVGIGIIFLLLLLITSLFIYRPWCHFFCPFGLVSWLFEKLSIFRIKVDYHKCDACGACAKACPSTVMDAILKRDRITPDCFACGNCIESCPTDAIAFTASRAEAGTYAHSRKLRAQKRQSLVAKRQTEK